MKAVVRHIAEPIGEQEYEAENIYICIHIPFVPTVGTALQVTPEGDYVYVHDVHWSVNDPGVLDIGTEEPDVLEPLERLLAEGWRVGDPVEMDCQELGPGEKV
ncbi:MULTISPECIES: hypothetical protein [Acidithiobacillus]|uniref:Uncharacterized protein n=2 Tax=Acidithiobacillus TaxID=119977 RepID=A0A179B8J0_ACIFR|nr:MULTISPECIES: hypothetical protein [Acidithiobacillus]MEB8487195.1 hypothetical protein [Acidithiobacillus ferriphilus]MEB8490553.1 hypothetical protein [Acidithiobacillus ferriphilus]MEB8494243.1 hypothetical protein [Acidithiobacillus ferriphilus]MEB8515280.1 hypothetical protein [Acidithiobacillus ferriphilus]MEB8522284.1 hypothetical protein [Acidithiobacillus ferriphilus]